MNAFLVDLTHGGVKISSELAKSGEYENVFAYDLYGTLKEEDENFLKACGVRVLKDRDDFKEAIDSYLENCKKCNEVPEKQCKGSLNIRLGTDLHAKAKMKSIEQNISINELIKNAVIMYLKTN